MNLPEPRASSTTPRRYSKLLWIGLAILVLGTGPLLAIILAAAMGWTSDPNPNPVGPGILAGLTFWPGVGLTTAGGILTLRRGDAGRQ